MFGRRATTRARSGHTRRQATVRAGAGDGAEPSAAATPSCDAPRRLDEVLAIGLGGATAVMLALSAGGCGSPNPRILDATEEARVMPSAQLGNEATEQDKIQALLERVRSSEHVFIHDDIERQGAAAADKLKLLLERDPTGVRSAREFIERIAAPDRGGNPADRVLLSEDESVTAKHWFAVQLAQIEGRPAPEADPEEVRQAQVHARRLRILDALAIVERSDLRFVAPPRKTMPKPTKQGIGPRRKPKRKEYTGPQFAEMLRTKWEFLGADIDDVDTFVDEIASDSFATMVRYRVLLEDGTEEDFATWLKAQLDLRRQQLAQGGAP